MICTNCGRKIPNTAKVCGHCGHRLKSTEPISAQRTTVSPAPAQRAIPGWMWGLIGGLIAVTGIAIFTAIRSAQANSPAIPPAAIVFPTDIPTPTPPPTEAPPTNTPLPTSTPEPEWVTVFSQDYSQEHSYEDIATTNGSFRISLRYYFGTKQEKDSKQCWEGIQLSDEFDTNDYLSFIIDRSGTFSVSLNEDGNFQYLIDDDWSAGFSPLNGEAQIEARDDMVTITINDQETASFEFAADDYLHNLTLYVSGPGEWCPELSIVTLQNLVVEELQSQP